MSGLRSAHSSSLSSLSCYNPSLNISPPGEDQLEAAMGRQEQFVNFPEQIAISGAIGSAKIFCPYLKEPKKSGTVKEVCEDFQDPYRELVMKYIEPFYENMEVSSRAEALELAFWWDETLEVDTDFWIQLHGHFENGTPAPKYEKPVLEVKKEFNTIRSVVL